MFCAECGNQLPAGASACARCGTRADAAPPHSTSELGNRVQARSHDALKAFKTIAINPVGGLGVAFQSVEKRQAMEIGIVFAAVFEISTGLGLYLALPSWGSSPGLADFLKLLIVAVVPIAAMV